MQNFAGRVIAGTSKFDHIQVIATLRDQSWFPIQQNLLFCNTVMALKCTSGQAPRYLSDQFTTRNY